MKKSVLLSLLASIWWLPTLAQYPASTSFYRNTLQLGIGLNHLLVQDQNASPLTYTGKLPQVAIQYKHLFSKGELQLDFRASYGSYYPRAYPNRAINYGEFIIPIESKLAAAAFSLNYLRQVYNYQKGALLVGTGVKQLVQYPTEAPHAGLIAVSAVPILFQVSHQVNAKNRFDSQIQYSLVGLVTRLPWHGSLSLPEVTSNFKALYQNNTQLETARRLNQFTWRNHFQHHLNKHLQVGLTYELERLHHAAIRPLGGWSNSVSLTSAFLF